MICNKCKSKIKEPIFEYGRKYIIQFVREYMFENQEIKEVYEVKPTILWKLLEDFIAKEQIQSIRELCPNCYNDSFN